MGDLLGSALVRRTYSHIEISHTQPAVRYIVFLLFVLLPTILFAQDSNFFRDKLGKPSELYRSKSGVTIEVRYDDKGQACSATFSPTHPTGYGDIQGLMPFVDELLPSSTRGKYVEGWEDIGNCTNIRYKDYERLVVEINDNACYNDDRLVLVYFKKHSCPALPTPPKHTSMKR